MNKYITDERVGCVAVYKAPRQNCLSGITQRNDCVFYRNGKRIKDHWQVSWWHIFQAKLVALIYNYKGEGNERQV